MVQMAARKVRCWQTALFKLWNVNCSRYEEQLRWRCGLWTLCCLLAWTVIGGLTIGVDISRHYW